MPALYQEQFRQYPPKTVRVAPLVARYQHPGDCIHTHGFPGSKLVADLLKQREAAIKDFDEKLAKLGYHSDGKQKRSHHRKSATPAQSAQKDKAKA